MTPQRSFGAATERMQLHIVPADRSLPMRYAAFRPGWRAAKLQFDRLKRRDFITLVGGAAAWPLGARAQQPDGMRRVGALMNLTADDPEASARVTAFAQELQQLGWTAGRNVRIDYRWGAVDLDRSRGPAAELVALVPDVVLAVASPAVLALQQATRTVPMVFVNVIDPVSAGFVESMARPGGNATGFIAFEYVISAKWLELLKDIAPRLTRVAVLRDADAAFGIGQLAVIQAAASSLGVEVRPIGVRDTDEIERAITAFARSPDGGLIVTASTFAAVYVDRILKGKKPADLPVQAPTKYQLVINSRTAKALGIDIPGKLLAIADEVVE